MSAPLPAELRAFLFGDEGGLLLADLVSWAKWRGAPCGTPDALWAYCEIAFRDLKEFRSLVDYRLRGQDGFSKRLPAWPRATDLYLFCDRIGGGFRIQHGHSTWVLAKAIGANFHVNQNVTIGFGRGGLPTIGDNVSVFAGAVVTGDIAIGDNVTIAPNAFVNFDVAADHAVFPAAMVVKAKKPRV